MKAFNFVLLATAASFSLVALADEPSGRASLTLRLDQYPGGIVSFDIRQEGDEITGRSSLRPGTVKLQRTVDGENVSLKGVGVDGFVDLDCTATRCEGLLSGGSSRLDVTDGGERLKGSVNFVRVRVKRSGDKLEVGGDGAMELRRTGDGRYSGSGMLNRDFNSRFFATLKTSGSLKDLPGADLVAMFLVAPLVRDR